MASKVKDVELTYEILPLELLKPNPKNPNKMDERTYAALINNIKREGFKDPILLVRDGESFVIVDGHHRKKALLELGFSRGPCVIAEGEGLDTVTLSTLMLNKIKGRLDPAKVGAILLGLREEYSAKELVSITGYSSQDLEKYASVLNTPELPDLAKFTNVRFIRFAGGKSRIAKKILGILPAHKIFVDVFGGSGFMVLNKAFEKGVIDVYNDLDGGLVNLFEVVRNQFRDFQKGLSGLLMSRELFDKFKADPMPEDPVEAAIRTYYLFNNSFFGEGPPKCSWGYSRERCVPVDFWNGVEKLEAIWRRLQTVYVEGSDFRKCIQRWDGPETVFFLDPPYYGIKYYKLNFEEGDHEDLYKLLCGAVTGKWVMTYNDHPWVRDKYRGSNLFHATSFLSMGRQYGGGTRDPYHTLVLMNYSPEALRSGEAES